jgi:hypothetical protein
VARGEGIYTAFISYRVFSEKVGASGRAKEKGVAGAV